MEKLWKKRNTMICSGRDALTSRPVEVEFNGTITAVRPASTPADVWVAPGWIDLQVNGYVGVDYNSPLTALDAIERSIHAQYRTGVTRLFPTVITATERNIVGSLANLAKAKESIPNGAALEGFHVEGPHISPEDGPRGAHPREAVRPPDVEEFHRWQDAARGYVRLVTLSPEWDEAPAYIEALTKAGIVVSIGHTKATKEQLDAAVSAGATMSTHLGNGAHATMARHPNYIWEQMADDRLTACLIVDGVHLPQCFVKVAVRAKGIGNSILVTDAVMPAGCEPGPYRLGEVDVELLPPGDRVVVRGTNRLAGSALSMDLGVSNLQRMVGISLADAVIMSTVNPAKSMAMEGRQQGLAPGDRADLVVFRMDEETKDIEVLETYVDGRLVYSRAGGE